MSDDGRALVLGGGGVAGIAWLAGVIAGLARAGTDVTGADLLLGTSAGATVAAQVAGGLPVDELFARQADPELQTRELVPSGGTSPAEFMEIWARLMEESGGDLVTVRQRIGARALAAETVPERERLAVIEARLPVHEWPSRALRITAVNALTGELRVFDRDSGVALVDAVAASSAVPMIWPPVTIDGVRYVDGGVRTMTNLDLAAGHGRVLLLAPLPDPALDAGVAAVAEKGGRVEVIGPDEPSLAAFGTDPLSPSTRTPAAEAGLAQGEALAAKVAAFWS
ncbi:patatin-like phospholipase family protein [Actinomadura chibensis]|uniref:Patatin-like phospholipase family protein n=1 Tax=Actinomadura chibensis TaxID=392828 RepID=A0A5D0NE90_9ACTN|nr:patatin-like phospholipase family protein [Actinomadura chibensis]TYB42541.1 patatin-like phospholipase family protein [Actinomadura chibensis]